MQLLCRYNKGIQLLLCVIDIFSIYTWVVPLKVKKGNTITYISQYILKYGHKPNKIWVYKGKEFYNRSMKTQLEDNDKEID